LWWAWCVRRWGLTKALGCPIHFSKTLTRIDRLAPMLGEHSRALLREYAYSDREIDGFVDAGVIEEAES
jgi:crotonobetainyl-CoA:carnitine CoA-transferase CaiB-like acyl-CoA transferase